MNYKQQAAHDFAQRIKALGFVVYLAKQGDYGFITDESGERVLSFSFSGLTSDLSGNYGPPSTTSGTGWKMEADPGDMLTADDVRRALYANAPSWCGTGWKHYATAAQHLATYNASSRYELI